MLGVNNMANDAYIPDDFQNEEDAQINQEEYELWIYECAVKKHNQNLADELGCSFLWRESK